MKYCDFARLLSKEEFAVNESLKQRMKNEQMSRVCIDMFSGFGGDVHWI